MEEYFWLLSTEFLTLKSRSYLLTRHTYHSCAEQEFIFIGAQGNKHHVPKKCVIVQRPRLKILCYKDRIRTSRRLQVHLKNLRPCVRRHLRLLVVHPNLSFRRRDLTNVT